MARIETDPNYSSPTFSRATAAADIFKKEDVQALAAAVSTHDHSTGKGLALSAGSIPNGSITSAMIADGTIVTADIAANAATIRYRALGVTVGPSTTSAAFVDMPEMVYTFTPPVVSDVYVEFVSAVLMSGAGAYALFQPVVDGSSVPVTGYFQQVGVNGTISFGWLQPSLAASSHTIKIQWSVQSGGTINATGVLRMLSLLEFLR